MPSWKRTEKDRKAETGNTSASLSKCFPSIVSRSHPDQRKSHYHLDPLEKKKTRTCMSTATFLPVAERDHIPGNPGNRIT